MQIPLRVLRAQRDEAAPTPPPLTPREAARRTLILDTAERAMARNGRHFLAFNTLAALAGLSAATVRQCFADIDALLAAILVRHISAIAHAIQAVPETAPNQAAARRAAYLALARTPAGGLTDAHTLLVRDRHLLPPDERGPVEECRDFIGHLVAGEAFPMVLALLDAPEIPLSVIEHTLGRTAQTGIQAQRPAQAPANSQAMPPAAQTQHEPAHHGLNRKARRAMRAAGAHAAPPQAPNGFRQAPAQAARASPPKIAA